MTIERVSICEEITIVSHIIDLYVSANFIIIIEEMPQLLVIFEVLVSNCEPAA